MKKIAVMDGSSFNKMAESCKNFTDKNRNSMSKMEVQFLRNDMKALTHACNGFSISRYAADCLEIEEEIMVRINRPPCVAAADEVVTFYLEKGKKDEDPDVVFVVFEQAGFLFRTKQDHLKELENTPDPAAYIKKNQVYPHIRVAFNANYALNILNALKRGSKGVRFNNKPVYLDISSENRAMIFSTEPGCDEKLLLPVRVHQTDENTVFLDTLMEKEERKTILYPNGKNIPICPNCKKSLKFLRSKMLEGQEVSRCPFCGQNIEINPNKEI